jgi:hypothetical protein
MKTRQVSSGGEAGWDSARHGRQFKATPLADWIFKADAVVIWHKDTKFLVELEQGKVKTVIGQIVRGGKTTVELRELGELQRNEHMADPSRGETGIYIRGGGHSGFEVYYVCIKVPAALEKEVKEGYAPFQIKKN